MEVPRSFHGVPRRSHGVVLAYTVIYSVDVRQNPARRGANMLMQACAGVLGAQNTLFWDTFATHERVFLC